MLSNRTKKRLLGLLLLGALAAVSSGCMYAGASAQAEPELLKPVKREEDLFEVQRGKIERQIRGTGMFIPANTHYLQYASSGQVAKIHVRPGDWVNKGDVLMELNSRDMNMKIAEQRLVLAKAEDAFLAARSAGDPDKLRLAGLDVEVEQLKLNGLLDKLVKTKLVADRNGQVTFVDFMKPGDTVAAYRNVIGISDPRDLIFQYTVTAGVDLMNAELGMKAMITLDGIAYSGKVIQTPRTAPTQASQPQNDRNTRSLLVALDTLPEAAAMGVQAELSVVTASQEDTLIIPRVGLRSYQGRSFVHLKDGETRREVDVEKGLETATQVEIRRGLRDGQTIILNN